MQDYIEIRGAKLHNLKNIDIRIPHRNLVVITGPSGSGKSSLAFDTLYAEGQRRYVESLSAYARQFLEKMPKPDVESITGIPPAIAIQQKAPSGNPRSTVGTVTEIYDYLRLLYARIGDTHCPNCSAAVKKDQPEDVLNSIKSLPENTRFYIAFPFVPPPSTTAEQLHQMVTARGFIRIWQHDRVVDLREKNAGSAVEDTAVIVDRRIKTGEIDRSRLVDSIETAFTEGEDTLFIIQADGARETFSRNLVCRKCGTRLLEPQPRLFSFNNPFGACPGCQGFGDMMDLDIHKIIPDPTKSLRNGAIAPWTGPSYRHLNTRLSNIASKYGFSMEQSFEELTEEQKNVIINGNRDFIGIRGFFKKLERKKYKVHVRVFMSRYRSYFTCTLCHGKRLRPEALAITLNGKNISDLVLLSIQSLKQFFDKLSLPRYKQEIAGQLLKEIKSRLQYLIDVGLDYLHLDRRANTLSGGEFQRINLATALGTSLTGTLYILDEPTIGLHPRDTNRLIEILKSLVKIGNTAVVVEHERAVIRNADYLIDLGPAAGKSGGEVIYQGNLHDFSRNGTSLTAQYLSGDKTIPRKNEYRQGKNLAITLVGAREHNLKNITVRFPLGKITAVTGVSGSGKSTLIQDVLYNGYMKNRGDLRVHAGEHDEIRGLRNIYRMEMVDQSPIGRTPRSNPVTYIKGFDEIRQLYADLSRSKLHGFKPGHFSFNVPGGRCENCQGDGQLKIEMQFLADIYIECDICKGKRYKQEILDIYYKGKNINDVLEMSVTEALSFFSDLPGIARKIQVLDDVGLGYLKLGQPATTLSGGEAQRIKLAAHLNKKTHRDTLFIFDEPTTGLHFDDIARLLVAFDALLDRGASVLIIEHNLDVIQYADWIIDLGPEGGKDGGYIIAEGTPAEIMKTKNSYTGHYLQELIHPDSSV
ncbi:MAG: excinuclease ABC subunit UvrA [Calditrichaeota bacterium]|nr:excinuclease ABC subunit UvrA [Calditrichota bacterium]RQW00505.1 MAG: excinuclease ABC subunit UvrA [Calditrichota bacterium]